jgi:hypothetical protein
MHKIDDCQSQFEKLPTKIDCARIFRNCLNIVKYTVESNSIENIYKIKKFIIFCSVYYFDKLRHLHE